MDEKTLKENESAENEPTENEPTENEQTENEQNGQDEKTPLLEWLIAIVGALLVAGSIGFMLYSAFTESEEPLVNLTVKKEPAKAIGNGFLVKFTLENSGEENAAAVTVEGKIMEGEKEIETSSTNISYAPSNSKREGGLVFKTNPDDPKLTLNVSALGYEKP